MILGDLLVIIWFICCSSNLISNCYGRNVTFSKGTVLWDGTNANGAYSVCPCDVDNDGDVDILAALWMNNKIVWFNNTDGKGLFSLSAITISTAIVGTVSVFASDLDNDGDLDVLSASYHDNKIAWYSNMDGKGLFSSQYVISSSVSWAMWVYAADLDGDSDNDVLATAYGGNNIVWFRNNGAGSFSSQIIITNATNYPRGVFAIDLDQDGDYDVISASEGDWKIAWYKNLDGLGTFSTQIIISANAVGSFSVYACDIDGDGDNDILSASYYDNKIAWYRNNGTGTFSSEIIISSNAIYAYSVFAIDIDGDNDLDVLSASGNDNKVAWYENIDAFGIFSSDRIITTSASGAMSVYSADFDGDGDNDVISASTIDDRVIWYQNYRNECVRPTDSIFIYSNNCPSYMLNRSSCIPSCNDGYYPSSPFTITCFSHAIVYSNSSIVSCLPFAYLHSACPNQLRVQLNQSIVIQGSGFINDNATRCILNRVYYSTPIHIDDVSVTCRLYWPDDFVENMDISLHIAAYYVTGSALTQTGLKLTLISACESAKPGSKPGVSGACECSPGSADSGTACIPCENGFYQDEFAQTSCKPCGNNQDTNLKTGSISSSACVCSATYYFNPVHKKCDVCVEGMLCPGNDVVIIRAGYWRANSITSSVLTCPAKQSACSGTQNSSSSLCNHGYKGPLCTVCEYRYAKLGETCVACLSSALNGVILFLFILLAIGLTSMLVRTTATSAVSSFSPSTNGEYREFEETSAKKMGTNQATLGVIVKVTLNYLQVLYYIGRLSANWSGGATKFYTVIGQSTLTPNFSIVQCALKWTFYQQLITMYLSPLIVTTLLISIYMVRHFMQSLSVKQSRIDCQFAAMLVLYQLHPTIMLEVISSLPCKRISGTGTTFLKADMSVDCSKPAYTSYAIISYLYLIFYTFGMIAFVVYRGLYHNAKSGKLFQLSHNAHYKYAFFFHGYRESRYYWEAVVMTRKLIIVALSGLGSSGLQLIWASFVMGVAFVLNVTMAPYSMSLINRLESASLIALYGTVMLGFHYLLTAKNRIWSTALLVLIDGGMVLFLFACCLKSLRTRIKNLESYFVVIYWDGISKLTRIKDSRKANNDEYETEMIVIQEGKSKNAVSLAQSASEPMWERKESFK